MATKTWKSIIPSTWATAASWDPSGLPATGDDVIFNSTYSGNCSITTTSNCRSIVMTGYSGIISGSGQINISGSNTGTLDGTGNTLVLSGVGTASNFIYSGALQFTSANGSGRIYCNGKIFNGQVLTFNSASGNWSFMDTFYNTANLVFTAGTLNINADFSLNIVTNTFTFTSGTLNVNNGANVTTGLFLSSVGNTRVLNMGSGTWTIKGSGTTWNVSPTSLTFNSGTSRILFTNSTTSAVTFNGGGLTYYTVECNRGGSTGNFTFASINNTTITNFIDVTSTAAHSVLFNSSGTLSFHRFIVKGNPGALITVGRTGAVTGIVVSKLGRGIVSCDYLALGLGTGFSATPSNTWYAGSNSTGSAAGWVITNPPSSRPLLGSGGVG